MHTASCAWISDTWRILKHFSNICEHWRYRGQTTKCNRWWG